MGDFPPRSYWSPDHQCDHMWRQGLFKEVIEVKWGHYAGFPGGAVVLKKKQNCLRALETKELRVRSLGWEDALEQEMASVFLPGQRSLVGYSPWGIKVRCSWAHLHTTPIPLWQWPRSHTLQVQGPGIQQDEVKMSRVSDVTYLPIPQAQPLPLPS